MFIAALFTIAPKWKRLKWTSTSEMINVVDPNNGILSGYEKERNTDISYKKAKVKVKWMWSRSVVSDSLWPHGLQPTRLLCPWDFPRKNTGVGCHFLLQGIFLTQGSNPGLLHCRQMLYRLCYQESPILILTTTKMILKSVTYMKEAKHKRPHII